MAITIKYTFTCPRCEEGVQSTDLSINCPACGFLMGPDVPHYTYPVTLCEQHQKYGEGPAHLESLMSMPYEKAMSILNDGLNIIEMIPAKKGSLSDIRNVLGIAVRIGEIAQKYTDFLDAKGQHVPSYITKLHQKDQENSNEQTPGTREEPTSSE